MNGYGNSVFLRTALGGGGGGVDPDAQAFITAAAITDPTQQAAINTLVVDLKGYSIWTKMKALYPFVGGTATTHKFNLKNPLDTNAAYRILWNGDVTHSSNGILGGGVNGFGNTNLVPSVALTNNSLSLTVYSRTSSANARTEMGCSTTSFLPIIGLNVRGVNGTVFDGYDFTAHRLQVANSDGTGLYSGNILTSTNQKIYKNGIQVASNTIAQTQSQPTVQPIYILARNDSGTASNYSDKNLAFASIGDGLTDTDATNLNTRVTTFQTSLNRNI